MKTRKELKEAYKNKKFKMVVFQIRNTANGKIFIESSTNLEAIWNRHRAQLNFGGHPNPGLQADWKTMGEAGFVYEILEELDVEDDTTTDYSRELKALEEMYMEELQPFGEKGYHRVGRK
ncbi:MAG: GIY-YIG nuclease family protein [Saprospirales bacterium]|nr:GIY-YIG nuclease family protein [Saprospirales bacterium]